MSAFNPWKALQGLLSGPPLQAGVVLSIADGLATVELPGGGRLAATGPAEVGQTVFVRGGVIEGEAADLGPIEIIDI
jgi:hypothetical protein